jgi:hypothetical protein
VALEVGPSERVVRLFTDQVTLRVKGKAIPVTGPGVP